VPKPRRLIYGFLSQTVDPINIKLPWQFSEQDGAFAMNYNKTDAVRDNLIAWAHTNFGDRPYRFYYGLDAVRFLFEPTTIAKSVLENNARDQLSKHFPYLKIDSLKVTSQEDDPNIAPNVIVFYLEASFKDKNSRKIKISESVGL
jgi:hypothetical protein